MIGGQVFSGYSDHFDAEVRLLILRAIAEQSSKTMSDKLMMYMFREYAIRKTIEYLRTQLTWLEEQGSAVRLSKAGDTFIAELTQQGFNHLDRIAIIDGIATPALPR